MTKRRGPPAPDHVRCPNCESVAWRRAGERIVEARSPSGVALRREKVTENRPWDWTCEQCRYAVRPTSRLDNDLSRTQLEA